MPLITLCIYNASWITVAASLVLFLAIRGVIHFMEDPYGSFHLTLNKDKSRGGQTEWMNMGYWKEKDKFPQACKALAEQVMFAAHCSDGDRILDVGHACGESLLMYLCDKRIPYPTLLCGITSLPWQHQRALKRVKECNPKWTHGRVYLYQGDAVYQPLARGHPLDPASQAPGFNAITVVDCAYHFCTRYRFLRQCFERLEPGGWIGLADLCWDSSDRGLWLHSLCLALGIPRENLWDRERYLHELQLIGFVECGVQDVSSAVFPGFREFLRSRSGIWGLFEKFSIGLFADHGGRYVIVSARKP